MIYKQIAAFQQECPIIHKDTQGYGYSYADLPKIFQVINPILKKHGLGFTQLIQPEGLETIVFSTTDDSYLKSITPIPQGVQLSKMNEFQVLGSAITYLRRYALSSMLGLVTDKDIDAAGVQIKEDLSQWHDLVNGCNTVDELNAVYKQNKEAVEKNANIKTLFTKRKSSL